MIALMVRIADLRLALIFICTLFTASLSASELLEHVSDGWIDWGEGYIYATGYGAVPERMMNSGRGKLMARRAAQVDAYRRLAEITEGVRVTSTLTVGEVAESRQEVRAVVKAVVKGAEVVKEDLGELTARVTLRIPMSGRMIRALIPERQFLYMDDTSSVNYVEIWISQLLNFMPAAYASQEPDRIRIQNDKELQITKRALQRLKVLDLDSFEQELSSAVKDYEQYLDYDGLVVDARGVSQFEVVVKPVLVANDGSPIYPTKHTSYDSFVSNMPVSYKTDVEKAMLHRRVAVKPLKVIAKSIYREKRDHLVVDAEDVKVLKALMDRPSSSLNQARVIVVVAN